MKKPTSRKSIRQALATDTLYKDNIKSLVNTARAHLISTDEAIDVAHEAFEKYLEYLSRNKRHAILGSSFILHREVMRCCRRRNRRVSIETTTLDAGFNNEDTTTES